MAAGNFDIKEIEKRMKGSVSALKSEFGGLRTGRASTTLLDPLMVNTSYGQKCQSVRWLRSTLPSRA